MKAQAQAAPIIQKPVHDPLPPVVVKIGGGEEPPPRDGVPITIDSLIDWIIIGQSNKTPIPWTRSQTTSSGRIHGLIVQDHTGPNPVVFNINPRIDALTTLTLYFASPRDAFKVSEVPDEGGSIYLEAQSNDPFEAENPTGGRWTKSDATFLSSLVKVEFRQRKIGSNSDVMRFEYVIDSKLVDVSLEYEAS